MPYLWPSLGGYYWGAAILYFSAKQLLLLPEWLRLLLWPGWLRLLLPGWLGLCYHRPRHWYYTPGSSSHVKENKRLILLCASSDQALFSVATIGSIGPLAKSSKFPCFCDTWTNFWYICESWIEIFQPFPPYLHVLVEKSLRLKFTQSCDPQRNTLRPLVELMLQYMHHWCI